MMAKRVVRDLSQSGMNSGQTFFKCISSSEKMGIPPTVVSEMQGALANRVILRDRYKNLWPVEVERNGDDWSFKKGWPQFYEENSLVPGNFLVFEYKGNNLFDFTLFGDNACEKKGIGAPKFKVKEEVEDYEAEEEEEEQEDEEEEEEEDLNDDDEEEEDDDDDEDCVQEKEESEEEELVEISKKNNSRNTSTSFVGVRTFTKKKGIEAPMCKVKEEEAEEVDDDEKEKEESADSDDDDQNDEHESDMQMEDAYDKEEEQVKISKTNKSKSKTKSSRAPTLGYGAIPRRRTYKKKYVPNCYGSDIFKLGLATRPIDHPFFVSRSRTSRKNELLIPKDVIVDYKLEIPEEITLVDEEDRRWKAKMKQWKDGRVWCTQGWKSLCRVNNIDKDDTCICEFVKKAGEDSYILVRVVDGLGGSI